MTLSAQSRVLQAVCQGGRTARRIAEIAQVDEEYIYVHLRRLRSKGQIKTVRVPKRGAWTTCREYHVSDVGCLLSEIW